MANETKIPRARLGKEKDIDLAAEFGVSRQWVARLREQHGIPAYRPEPRMEYPLPICFTKKDQQGMKKAMKKAGIKNRSAYIRQAVRDKNKATLEGAK